MIESGDDGSCILRLYVQPGARSSRIVGPHGDALKVRVTAPPEDGRANRAVVALLAEVLGVPTRDVTVIAGEHARHKRIRVAGLNAESVAARLAG